MPRCRPRLPIAPPTAKPYLPQGEISYLVLDGGNVAGSGLSLPEKVAQGITARAYLYTDRPAYRPGQDVALRGVVREVVDGQYANIAEDALHAGSVRQPGPEVRRCRRSSSPISARFPRGHSARFGRPGRVVPRPPVPARQERIRRRSSRSRRTNSRRLTWPSTCPGPSIIAATRSRAPSSPSISTGTPLANRQVVLSLPDGRTIQGKTDALGKFPFELETSGFSEEQVLRLVAQLPQDAVGVATNVMLAVRAFRINLSTEPGRLPRRRELRREAHDVGRPGRADRARHCRGPAQAGQQIGPGHRARGHARGGEDRPQDGPRHGATEGRRRRGRLVRGAGPRHRPLQERRSSPTRRSRSRARRTRPSSASWPIAPRSRWARRPRSA